MPACHIATSSQHLLGKELSYFVQSTHRITMYFGSLHASPS